MEPGRDDMNSVSAFAGSCFLVYPRRLHQSLDASRSSCRVDLLMVNECYMARSRRARAQRSEEAYVRRTHHLAQQPAAGKVVSETGQLTERIVVANFRVLELPRDNGTLDDLAGQVDAEGCDYWRTR